MSELLKRAITALIMIPLVSLCVIFSSNYNVNWPVAILMAIVVFICCYEYWQLMTNAGIAIERYSFLSSAVLIALGYGLFGGQYGELILWLTLVFPIAVYLFEPDALSRIIAAVGGLVYIPYLFHFLYLVYQTSGHQSDWRYALTLLVMVWAYDISAYLIGSAFGRHPLAPSLSPKKSWEGVIGGAILTLLAAILMSYWSEWVSDLASIPHLIVLSVLVSAFTQLGDLFESRLKRFAQVKDAGGLLPGHGGLLDRVDGLMFAAPVFYFYVHFVLGKI
ncbi:phosphatidate cytidylyltransferase [Candidatus Acetothermia bacterium]|nr:phosphatidate cytidylyltransferase [Candidatus Acetothermia bacterium]